MMPVELRQPEVERDRWGRPKINGKTYQRPSTMAKAIEAAGGLPKWMGTRVFEGLREQPELLNAPGDIRELVEAAADAGGANAGSGFGTAVHEVVESLTMTGSVPTVLRSGTAPSEQHVECARSVLDLLRHGREAAGAPRRGLPALQGARAAQGRGLARPLDRLRALSRHGHDPDRPVR